MSTTFAIKINKEFENIALRHNGGRITIKNKLIYILKKSRKVYPIDNTNQGIYTVKDILTKVNEW